MRPFLLLGDITGAIAILGLAVLAFGGLLVFGGIQIQRTSASKMGCIAIGGIALALGTLMVLIALAFLFDVWDTQPDRALQHQIGEAEAAHQDTSWKAQARQSRQELTRFEQSFDWQRHPLPDSSQRDWIRQDSILPAYDKDALSELEW
ncbi:hypothetical protein [Hymenobacter rigui]|uniref:Uncharacterized protein n=1 Tax=Hymenobacter rigui TaxID=334424 RepID=A0A428K9W6_9BACT|nr:hypothetical protein [Hymenobacter rigui]RSK43173.1 hypothetical protein EI291_22195 [Hymenobacter rigui]